MTNLEILTWGCVIVLIIVIVYYYIFSDGAYRKTANAKLQQSNGVYDLDAVDALIAIDRIRDKTPEDLFSKARLLRYNLAENGEQHNIHPKITNEVVTAYRGAIQMIGDGVNVPNLDFHLNDILHIDNYLTLEERENDAIIHNIVALGREFTHIAPQAKRKNIEENIVAARSGTKSLKNAANKYFEVSKHYTSDAQNVHEHQVNNDLRTTYAKIRGNSVKSIENIEKLRREIFNKINSSTLSSDKKVRAADACEKMLEGGRVSNYNATETEILRDVWLRADDPSNHMNRINIYNSIIESLADCHDGKTLVCANGRAGRIISSLALLDADKSIGTVMTVEAYQNQILQESQKIIEQIVADAKTSSDKFMADAAKLYETGEDNNVDINKSHIDVVDSMKKIQNNINTEIKKNIDSYRGKLDEVDLENIRKTVEGYTAI